MSTVHRDIFFYYKCMLLTICITSFSFALVTNQTSTSEVESLAGWLDNSGFWPDDRTSSDFYFISKICLTHLLGL